MRPSDRAPGLLLGDGVTLPESVVLGANVVVHAGTVVGDRATIADNVVLGKPLTLAAASTAARDPLPPAEIGAAAIVGAGAIVFAGTRIGASALVGDQAHVRERSVVGERSVIGRGSAVDNDVVIGARVKVQTACYLTAFSVIEDDVFVAPGVMTTNDPALTRHPPDFELRGAVLRRAARIGGGAILLPGIEVGEEGLVGAGSVVTRDVPPRTVVVGAPARRLRDVRDDELLERWT